MTQRYMPPSPFALSAGNPAARKAEQKPQARGEIGETVRVVNRK